MAPDDLTTVRRLPHLASYDKELLLEILRNGLVCHVAFQIDGQPFVIPMAYYNDSKFIYIHGSTAARITNALGGEVRVAISVLELNGLVLAKGLADNSMNYRSAVIFGKPVKIEGEREKQTFFEEWIDNLVPGRKANTTLPNRQELKNVTVYRVRLNQFSVKVSEGAPSEWRKDPRIWSGVVPISVRFSDPEYSSSSEVPDYIRTFIDTRNGRGKQGF